MAGVTATPRAQVEELVNRRGLEQLFSDQSIDCLVCRAGVNVVYLSGIATPGTLGRHLDLTETPREAFVVWPASGDPLIVISAIASQVGRMSSRIQDITTYRDYVDQPESALADVLQRLNVATSRVGFDQAWFGARRWAELLRKLPEMTPVDCTEQLEDIRSIKTPSELQRLERAAGLLDQALLDVFPSVTPGQTEREVNARICARALELGATSVHGILQGSSNPVLYGGESDHPLSTGDLVRTDYVAYVDGYAANLSRLLHVGTPGLDVRRRYSTYLGIYEAAVAMLRPGARGGDLHRSIRSLFESQGWEAGPAISGHGIGVWFHQQHPFLVEDSTDVLRPGMVIAIEPISGHWHLQDEYLITEGDPKRISDTFDLRELPWAG